MLPKLIRIRTYADVHKRTVKLLVSIKEAAQRLGVGRTLTYHLIDKGQLDTVKIGTRRLVKIDSIKALVERAAGGAE